MPLNEIQQVKTKVKTKSPRILWLRVPHEQESLSSLLLDLEKQTNSQKDAYSWSHVVLPSSHQQEIERFNFFF